MSIVLIFTSFASWRGIGPRIRDRVPSWDLSYYPNSDYPVKKCEFLPNEPAELKDPDEDLACLTDGVYLVYDKIDNPRFSKLLDLTEKNESYVLVHRHGNHHENDIPSMGKRITVSGIHTSGIKYFYTPVFNILTDGNGNEQERIVALFNPPLEAVLRFLNECQKPGNTNPQLEESFNKILLDADKNEEVREAVTAFYEKYKEQTALEDYEEDLIQIRDASHYHFLQK